MQMEARVLLTLHSHSITELQTLQEFNISLSTWQKIAIAKGSFMFRCIWDIYKLEFPFTDHMFVCIVRLVVRRTWCNYGCRRPQHVALFQVQSVFVCLCVCVIVFKIDNRLRRLGAWLKISQNVTCKYRNQKIRKQKWTRMHSSSKDILAANTNIRTCVHSDIHCLPASVSMCTLIFIISTTVSHHFPFCSYS
jgi:hypothetical protein